MGQYLATPALEKETLTGSTERLHFGITAMQGWRRTMEDAHIAEHVSDEVHIFGVFDGHGGPEVALFCSKRMPDELRCQPAFQAGQYEDALTQVFHRMDEMMRSREGLAELEALRRDCESGKEGGDEEGEDTYGMLRKLAQLQRMAGRQPSGGNGGGDAAAAGEAGAGEGSGGGGGASLDAASASLAETTVQAGCTAVVALIVKDRLYVANAGDSRAVLCRGGKALAMSEDHKPAQPDERARIMAAGGFLSEIGGITRVNGNLNLSRAIGDLRYKMNAELEPKDQIITAEPDVASQQLCPEDAFMVLACDGIWDVMDNQQVVDFVRERLGRGTRPADVAAELLSACLARDPREARGVGCDNMTAAIVVFEPPPQGAASAGSCPCGAHSSEAEHAAALANGHSSGGKEGGADTAMREATPQPEPRSPAATPAAAAKA